MSKKEALTEDARNAIFDAARAGVLEAYAENAGVRVNYFRAVEMLLYNYRKMEALVEDEDKYLDFEYFRPAGDYNTVRGKLRRLPGRFQLVHGAARHLFDTISVPPVQSTKVTPAIPCCTGREPRTTPTLCTSRPRWVGQNQNAE